MRAGRVGLPWAARGLIACAVSGAAACAAPALLELSLLEWPVLLPLAALYAICEYAPRCPLMGHKIPGNMGAFFPVLLTGAFLLPPESAALVPLPGALIGRVEPRNAAARRVWHAAQLALAAWASAQAATLLDGRLAAPGAAGSGAAGPAAELAEGPELAPFVAGFPGLLLAAAAAAVVFCAVVTVLDGVVLVAAERCAWRAAWRGQFQRAAAPHLLHGAVGLMMAVLWRSTYGPAAAFLVLLPMYICCWVFAQYHRERGAHQSTIRALVQAVDIKDRYTRGHSERVGRASVMIARELGMDDERTEALRFAGILHDVGKLGVPTRLLRKDGPLTPEERRIIELHPEYGHEMVRGIGFLGEARSAILHHHERMDGSGYPYGLSGTDIPEFARVVAVADAFDAMTSTRSYRRARPVGAAVTELKRCEGTQFDARMVRALARALERQGWSPAVTADRTGGGNVPAARDLGERGERGASGVSRASGERGDPGERALIGERAESGGRAEPAANGARHPGARTSGTSGTTGSGGSDGSGESAAGSALPAEEAQAGRPPV